MKNTATVPVSQTEGYDGDEWDTPKALIETVRNFYGASGGIDLDPCSCEAAQNVVKACEYFSKEDNCLKKRWWGNVWLNPPYSGQNVRLITAYAIAQYKAQRNSDLEILTLVNNCTETQWFRALSEYPVILSSSRLKYWRETGEYNSTRQGQALFYLGKRTSAFFAAFRDFGYAPNMGFETSYFNQTK